MSARQFKGRVVVKGSATAEALVSKGGFNTLASYQHSLMFGDKASARTRTTATCTRSLWPARRCACPRR